MELSWQTTSRFRQVLQRSMKVVSYIVYLSGLRGEKALSSERIYIVSKKRRGPLV